MAQEREEIALYPEQEVEELRLIYEARGIPPDQAEALGRRILADPDHALDVMAREELGLNPDELGSPWGAAGSSFFMFAIGAILPLLPFVFSEGVRAVVMAAGATAGALFAVGAALSLFSGRNALYGGARMTLIGSSAAALTYLVGHLLGVGVVG